MDFNGEQEFTEEELTDAFDGYSEKIFEKELYPIDVLFDD